MSHLRHTSDKTWNVKTSPNKGLELTASSVRSAPASGRGSCPAFGRSVELASQRVGSQAHHLPASAGQWGWAERTIQRKGECL